ncbi:MAG TPA: alkaline phosphatase family protein [Patescibacteria group bacterium]|nr:alkaline phosphatase family protein [Patescibacteria group bacterium]
MARKILVIGLDGMPESLIKKLGKQGIIPNLYRLYKKGVFGSLESTMPPITAPAWVSFATGVNPGKHGCFNFLKLSKGSLSVNRAITSRDIKSPTLYEILNLQGKKSILINLPVSFPPITNDIILTSIMSRGENFIFPQSLKKEMPILKKYRVSPNPEIAAYGSREKFATEVRRIEKIRFDCAKQLFQKKEWDFFFLLISSPDWIQHKCFDRLVSGKISKNSESCNIYQDIDKSLGWFLENIKDDTSLIIISDHGFKVYEGFFYVNAWLHKEGLLQLQKVREDFVETPISRLAEEKSLAKKKKKRIKIERLYNFLVRHPFLFRKITPSYRYIKSLLPFYFDLSATQRPDIPSSKAVSISIGANDIYFHDKNRFSDGLLSADAYRRLLKEVKTELSQLKSPLSREKLFKKVFAKDEIYSGDYTSFAPDLLLEEKSFKTSKETRPAIFSIQIVNSHSPDGIFIGYGSEFVKGKRIKNLKIFDIAPLILHLLDIPIPKNMDGRIRRELFDKDSFMAKRAIKTQSYRIKKTFPKKYKEGKEDTEEVKRRLKTLGYF